MEASAEDEAVLALDAATGETVWRVPVGPFVEAELGDGGPRSTPAVADGMVIAVSSQARLVALAAADGALLWEKDLTAWGPVPRFGYSMSPLVDGELVIVEAGERQKEPGVLAFDRGTGELRWSALAGPHRLHVAGGRDHRRRAPVRLRALQRGGRPVGRRRGPLAPRGARRHAAIPMPVLVAPDRIFISSSEDTFGSLMLRVSRADDGYRTEELWSQRLMRNHFNSSVEVGGFLYGFDNGTLRCLDAASGERRWSKRGFGKGSLVAAGEHALRARRRRRGGPGARRPVGLPRSAAGSS